MSKQIQTTELDFDRIKANMKQYLTGQTTLTDYDYEGSVMSTLLDVLAYNTHYNALYQNMALNESFLDSASKYSSAISLSKMLGYTPFSTRSAHAKIDLIVTPPSITSSTLTVPRGTLFRTVIGDTNYAFTTMTDYTAGLTGSSYIFNAAAGNQITLLEGTKLTKKYTVSATAKYVIPNATVDMSTVNVKIQDSSSSSVYTKWVSADGIVNVKGTDLVYFVKLREDGFYEIYFGNGSIGAAVVNGNVVHIEYMVSAGSVANGAKYFTYAGGFDGNYDYNVTVIEASIGGTERESLDSVKYNAPRAYITQDRAVTPDDYTNLLVRNFPEIEAVNVWGGQDHIPKQYGKVFICAKPYGADTFTDEQKNNIKLSLLKSRNIVSVTPEFIDPLYLKIKLEVGVYYNAQRARKTVGEIQTAVVNAIGAYADTLNKFDSVFRFSKLGTIIDAADDSIVSNISKFTINRPVDPLINVLTNYAINFANPIYRTNSGGGNVLSTKIYVDGYGTPCYIKDNNDGILYLINVESAAVETNVGAIGTVDYSAGKVVIQNMMITGLFEANFAFDIIPASNDVVPAREYIITLPKESIVVNMISDQVAAGNAQGGAGYIFTTSR